MTLLIKDIVIILCCRVDRKYIPKCDDRKSKKEFGGNQGLVLCPSDLPYVDQVMSIEHY